MRRPLLAKCVLMHAILLSIALTGCRTRDARIEPDASFTPYIRAFSTGYISARSPILVSITDEQRWLDTTEAAIQGIFEFDPAVNGRTYWHDANTLAFQPNERLAQDRTYTVTFRLAKLIELPKGTDDFRFQVTTHQQNIDPKITEMRSIATNDLSWQQLIVSVYTSDDATGQDLDGSFTATQGDHTLPLNWQHEPNGKYHRFVVDSVRRSEDPSEVEITWNGERIGSKDKGSIGFTVPSINELSLISSDTETQDEQKAILLFSDPLDEQQDLEGIVGIAGAEGVRISIDGNKILLYPQDRLSGDQQAFVSASLRNVNGRQLGQDITIDLLFEELKPAVRMVGNGVILPSSDGLVMPFEAVNLNAIDVRVIKIHESNITQFLQVNRLDGERELARVGRLVTRKTVPLNTADDPDRGKWNRYFLDLEDHFKSEPGAIYRIELSFDRRHSTYPCEASEAIAPERERTWEEEQAEYDRVDDHWYYDDYYYDEYDYAEREDPCSGSYFAANRKVTRNLLASDLGLIAKRGNDGSIVIAVSDLISSEPVQGVRIDVLDLQRKSMVQASTDRNGLAHIASTKNKPFMLIASKGDQRGYLKLDDGLSLSVSEFDVQGEAVDRGLKGFIYGERGVWRPGDSLYITFILQDALNKLPKDHPVVLELTDPRGRLDQKHVRTSGIDGMYAFRMATSPDAPTGMWGAQVTVGGTRFHQGIRIETVKPNRLKVLLDIGNDRLIAGDANRVELSSHWLHGAPARGLNSRVTVTMTAGTPQFDAFKKFHFSDLKSFVPEEEKVVFEGPLNAEGEVTFPLDLDLQNAAPALVNTNIVTRVFEAGGDASMDRMSIPYYPYSSYAGLKLQDPGTAWGSYLTDTTYTFEVAAVTAEGEAIAGRELNAQIYKMNYDWWWDGSTTGDANYISSPSVQLISGSTVTTGANGTAPFKFRIDRPEWGSFVVRISDPISGHAAAQHVYLDWPGWEGRSRRNAPEQAAMLTFNSDKDKYNVGDQAQLTIPSSGTGRALVSIENGSRVIDLAWIDLQEKETRYNFKITEEMAPNVYAHVTLIQPHANTLNDMPIRLYGVIPIPVENASTHLFPRIAMPSEVRTDVPFEIEVSEEKGQVMTYTLAIVDEGLLDLTRFKTPDPWAHFYAREALGVRTWDMYNDVIGAFARQLHRLLALGGSDEMKAPDGARANRFKPVVRFAGPFTLQAGKKAKHKFTIGNYVGSVRVMVVATNGDQAYGSTEKTVPVRKPLMVLATMPRVLAPGEIVDLPVTVFAMDKKLKDVKVKIEPNPLLIPEGASEKQIAFSNIGDQVVTFKVRVKEAVGVAKMKVSVEGSGEMASEAIELQVRQPNLAQTDVTEQILEAGAKWTEAPSPIGVTGTNSAYLEISSIPPVDMGRRLQYLIGYPHGCLEQTLSKAFPQLFVSQVMELPERAEMMARQNVEAALRKLSQFQRNDGSFNYWPGGDHYDSWTSIYAGHFMIEAERQGYAVPGQIKPNWLNAQRRYAREWDPNENEGWHRDQLQLMQGYRLYVLALAKSQEVGAMNRLREKQLDHTTRWTLAAAYAVIGRNDAARELIDGLDTDVRPYREQAYTYGSDLRDEALIAEALINMGELAKAGAVVQRISKLLSSEEWYSTQSTAFGLLAVSRLGEKTALSKGMSFMLSVDGKNENRASNKAIIRADLPSPDGKSNFTIQNKGEGLLYARLVRTGTPLAGNEVASESGLQMMVEYQLMNGTPIGPGGIDQGTDFIALVTLRHPGIGEAHQNLALTQIFPSGWEIRNARLEGTEHAQQEGYYTYRDIRDDRVMTYFDLYQGQEVRYRVLLNAAYTGRYYLPGAHCEAMYDHTVNARTKGQWVNVTLPGAKVAAR